jgi:hypothetical protein
MSLYEIVADARFKRIQFISKGLDPRGHSLSYGGRIECGLVPKALVDGILVQCSIEF